MSRPPSATIFVGNLPFDLTEAQLTQVFESAGPVKSMRIVVDKESGRPKGFGFCEFFDVATAESAFRNLNGTDLSGRNIRIDYAEDFQTRGGCGGGRDYRDGRPPPGPVHSGPGSKPIGRAAADSASATVAQLLGGPPSLDREVQEQLNTAFANLSKAQLYDVMRDMKSLVAGDRAGARQYFLDRPWLTKVLFQGQILLGMVQTPPPPAAPMPMGAAPPGAVGYPPDAGGYMPAAGPYGGPQQPAMAGGFQEGMMGLAGRPTAPGGPPPPMQPMMQQMGMQPGGPLQPGAPIHSQAGYAPPPMQPGLAPQPQMQQPAGMPPSPQQPPAGLALADPNAMQALLRQVMSLSDDQIAALAPEHRQQVLYVKEQVRAGQLQLQQ